MNVLAIPRDARRLSWVLIALALALIPHVAHLSPLALVLIVGASIWRLVIELRGWKLPGRWVRVPITFAAVIGVLVLHRTLNGVEAGTALLAIMAGVKLLETRSVRDYTVLLFLSYFLLFAAFLYDQSLLKLPYMLVAAWLLTATLLRIHEPEAVMRVKEALGATGMMLLQALPIAALLFIFFPRLPGQFWSVPAREQARTGLDDEMTPGDVSELTISGAIAFRVRFDGPMPPPRERYWRGPVLHDFDGRTWRRQLRFLPPQEIRGIGQLYRYRMTMQPHQQRWVLGLDAVTDWDNTRARRDFDFQLIARESIGAPTSFDLQSHTRYETSTQLPKPIAQIDTLLTSNRNPRSLELALQMRREAGSDEAFIQAVLDKFTREEFFYTLQPPTLAANSVDDFLFNSRKGFCEHFASAFTMMMRAAGIPARVVTGYQGGEFNPIGGYLIVRQSDAHAWSEVWLAGRGWVRFDPTAAVAPERIEQGLEAAVGEDEPVPGRFLRQSKFLLQIRNTWDAANAFWNDRIVEFDAGTQASLFRELGIDHTDWRTIGLTLVFTLVAFFCLLALYLTWRYRHHVHDPVVRVYERLCRRLSKRSLPRLHHEGPREYLERVAAARADLAPTVRDFTVLYLQMRYHPDPPRDGLSRLRSLARAVRP